MPSHLTEVRSRLRIHAHRKVQGLLEGEYASLSPGRSTDFTDLREYVRGDDVKDVDWKASARSRTLLVKRYAAQRKLTVLLVVSTGRRMAALHDVDVPKRDLAVTVAGVVGHLAVRHGDLVGAVWGDASGQHSLPARSGDAHLERCLTAVHDATTPAAAPADLAAVLRYVVRSVRRRAVLLVVSDEDDVDDELHGLLRRLAVQHEVLWMSVGDLDATRSAGEAGRAHRDAYRDVDSGEPVPAWLRDDPELVREHAARVAAAREATSRRLDGLGVAHEHTTGHGSAVLGVLRLLERHARARRG